MAYRVVTQSHPPVDRIAKWIPSLLGVFLLFAVSREAHACSACTMSIVNLLFPFMWEATWVLGVWRILYLFFQIDSIKSNPVWFVGRELGILFFLYLGFWWACFFLYFLGYLLYATYRSLRRFSPLKTGWASRIALFANFLAIVILIPIATKAYTAYAQQDDLEHLRHYVYPGTSQSRSLTLRIARDRSIDLSRIREMLSSPDPLESQKAFEVLYRRNDKQDLIELQDVILGFMDSDKRDEFIDSRRASVWLALWLDDVTGEKIRTGEHCEKWVGRETATTAE